MHADFASNKGSEQPRPTLPGYIAPSEAVERIGKRIFGLGWTGQERTAKTLLERAYAFYRQQRSRQSHIQDLVYGREADNLAEQNYRRKIADGYEETNEDVSAARWSTAALQLQVLVDNGDVKARFVPRAGQRAPVSIPPELWNDDGRPEWARRQNPTQGRAEWLRTDSHPSGFPYIEERSLSNALPWLGEYRSRSQAVHLAQRDLHAMGSPDASSTEQVERWLEIQGLVEDQKGSAMVRTDRLRHALAEYSAASIQAATSAAGYTSSRMPLDEALAFVSSVVGAERAWPQLRAAMIDGKLRAWGQLDRKPGQIHGNWLCALAWPDDIPEHNLLRLDPAKLDRMPGEPPKFMTDVEVDREQVTSIWTVPIFAEQNSRARRPQGVNAGVSGDGAHLVSSASIATEQPSRRRGPRSYQMDRVKAAMINDMRTGQILRGDLELMLEKIMEERYRASRDTCRKARRAALSEFVDNSEPDK